MNDGQLRVCYASGNCAQVENTNKHIVSGK